MAQIKNKLSEETLEKVTPLIPKLMLETSGDVFTKPEILILEEMYREMTGRPAGTGCGRMCSATLVLCQNYFKIYPTTEIVEEIMVAEEMNYNDFTFRELKEMFPSLSAKSKKAFIKLIDEL